LSYKTFSTSFIISRTLVFCSGSIIFLPLLFLTLFPTFTVTPTTAKLLTEPIMANIGPFISPEAGGGIGGSGIGGVGFAGLRFGS